MTHTHTNQEAIQICLRRRVLDVLLVCLRRGGGVRSGADGPGKAIRVREDGAFPLVRPRNPADERCVHCFSLNEIAAGDCPEKGSMFRAAFLDDVVVPFLLVVVGFDFPCRNSACETSP